MHQQKRWKGSWCVLMLVLRSLSSAANPHDMTKSTDLELRFTWTETPKRGSLSIDLTDLYRGVIIPIFGNESMWSKFEGWW